MIRKAVTSTVDWLVVVSKAIAAGTAVMTFLGAVSWFLFQERLDPITSIPATIADTAHRIDDVDRRVARVERDVFELRGPERIAEYDQQRSAIVSPCAVGGQCKGQFRIRRTEFGLPCLAPTATYRVVNGRGLLHTVTEIDIRPVRASDDWEEIPFEFVVPSDSLPGRAEFFAELTYMCEGVQRLESTWAIPLTIIEP